MKSIRINPKAAISLTAGGIAGLALSLSAAMAGGPAVAAAPGEVLLALVHAEGAQVYECRNDAAGVLGWQFREPVATLIDGPKTVGRHYAGPSWEFSDGTTVTGTVVSSAEGRTAGDIPQLKLEAIARPASGILAGVSTILRVNTSGGVPATRCEIPGTFASVAYSADYKFYGFYSGSGDEQLGILHGPYDYLFGSEYPTGTMPAVTAGARSPRPAM